MSIYSHSNVNVAGGSSTIVAGDQIHIHNCDHAVELRIGLKKLFQHTTPSAVHNSGEVSDQPKCHPGTRVAILAHLLTWATSLIHVYPIMWLHGPAGAGKSAILRTITEKLFQERLLVASFFFFRTAAGRNTSEKVIATIAYQLALSIPETRQHIEEAVDKNPMIFSLSLWQQASALIVSPMVAIFYDPSFNNRYYPRIIVIDGLDECGDYKKQCELLRTLCRVQQVLPIPLSILVASRPEHHIRGAFNVGDLNWRSSRLALDDSYEPDNDIRKYITDRFDDIRRNHFLKSCLPSNWPSLEIIHELVAKASGQFIYVSTVDKFISSPRHNPAKRLDIITGALGAGPLKPFEQLDNLYSTIFHTIDEVDLPSTLRVLGALLVQHYDRDPHNYQTVYDFPRTRSPDYVEKMLVLESGDVRRLLFDLESLLAIGENCENVQIFHASLSDYLFDKIRSGKFWINAGIVYSDLMECYIHHLPQWRGVRRLFIWNCELFLIQAEPTQGLRKSIERCYLEKDIFPADNYDSNPHGLRDLLPTLLQTAIHKSRFVDSQRPFASQLLKFESMIGTRLRVYFSTINLKSFLIGLALVHNQFDPSIYFLGSREQDWERLDGFNLLDTRRSPAIMPFIRNLINDTKGDYFIDESQYTDITLRLLKCLLEPLKENDWIPTLWKDTVKTIFPILFSKSSIRLDLFRYTKSLLSNAHHLNELEFVWEAMQTYISKARVRIRGLDASYSSESEISKIACSQPLRGGPSYCRRHSASSDLKDIIDLTTPPPEMRRNSTPLGPEIIDLTTPPPETLHTGNKRKRRGSRIINQMGGLNLPLLEWSSSLSSKRQRITARRSVMEVHSVDMSSEQLWTCLPQEGTSIATEHKFIRNTPPLGPIPRNPGGDYSRASEPSGKSIEDVIEICSDSD